MQYLTVLFLTMFILALAIDEIFSVLVYLFLRRRQ